MLINILLSRLQNISSSLEHIVHIILKFICLIISHRKNLSLGNFVGCHNNPNKQDIYPFFLLIIEKQYLDLVAGNFLLNLIIDYWEVEVCDKCVCSFRSIDKTGNKNRLNKSGFYNILTKVKCAWIWKSDTLFKYVNFENLFFKTLFYLFIQIDDDDII